MASTTPATVTLSGPSTWEQWFEDTMSTVPSQFWAYYEPDGDAVPILPVEPIMPANIPPPEGVEKPQARRAREARNERQEDVYFKLFDIWNQKKREWDELQRVDAKLRERILTTVAPSKKAALRRTYPVRRWLTDLRASTALPLENLRQNLVLQYKKLMSDAHGGWPPGGPTTWLAKWEELINQAERYDEPLRTWLRRLPRVGTCTGLGFLLRTGSTQPREG